jgi:hypothetical protein
MMIGTEFKVLTLSNKCSRKRVLAHDGMERRASCRAYIPVQSHAALRGDSMQITSRGMIDMNGH